MHPTLTRSAELVDLLFNETSGAGFTILRNDIGSSPNSTQDWMNTIEPVGPARPDERPTYVWDGQDAGQFWIAQQAARYGVKTFYAGAWSAPGFMKNNSNDAGGGYLCGKFYKAAGIDITHLGFLNETDFTTAYASMRMTGAMAADFIKILQPVLAARGYAGQVKIACCDATGWATQRNMSRAILADAAAAPLVDNAWMTEYADLGGRWSTAWFSADAAARNDTKATAGDGLTWARNLHTGLTTGNLSAFLWWVATQDTTTNGNNSEKLMAPVVDTATSGLRTVAFKNANGDVSVVAINDSAEDVPVRVYVGVASGGGGGGSGDGAAAAAAVEAWVTDATRDMERQAAAISPEGIVNLQEVPAHGVLSVIVRASS
ncbi:hypothetical protein SCUCBS95973_005677 [Sporothrix curviconia]|uniref:Glycoside hydrolase family 30 protein n=1 Tax=Sporothrix curviconia TaxID=1260050 RepID=A0ABP0BYV3_9PEZI